MSTASVKSVPRRSAPAKSARSRKASRKSALLRSRPERLAPSDRGLRSFDRRGSPRPPRRGAPRPAPRRAGARAACGGRASGTPPAPAARPRGAALRSSGPRGPRRSTGAACPSAFARRETSRSSSSSASAENFGGPAALSRASRRALSGSRPRATQVSRKCFSASAFFRLGLLLRELGLVEGSARRHRGRRRRAADPPAGAAKGRALRDRARRRSMRSLASSRSRSILRRALFWISPSDTKAALSRVVRGERLAGREQLAVLQALRGGPSSGRASGRARSCSARRASARRGPRKPRTRCTTSAASSSAISIVPRKIRMPRSARGEEPDGVEVRRDLAEAPRLRAVFCVMKARAGTPGSRPSIFAPRLGACARG